MNKDILQDITGYFKDMITREGPVPAGVGWNSDDAQKIRFQALCGLIRTKNTFSLNDLGCGYGKLADFLSKNFPHCTAYYGYDLSEDMITSARQFKYSQPEVIFQTLTSSSEMRTSDFSVASGIFNVKMEYTKTQWLSYILETLEYLNQKSKKGFAFNMLTNYSDAHLMRDDLYYADPCFIFDFCKRNYSRNVSLIHDYDLYDFTIHVTKGPIQK